MKIAFDAQLLSEKQKTGIGFVAKNIVTELASKEENKCFANYFSFGANKQNIETIREYKNLGIELNECKWFNNMIYRLMWCVLPIPYSLFFGRKADVSLFFNYYLPPFVGGKKVTMIHDMVCMDCPETMNFKTKMMLKMTLKKSIRRADKIIAVSQFSKERIMYYFDVPDDKIAVMPNGVDLDVYRDDFHENQVEDVCLKYAINSEYFLYLGTLEPRKNIERIIEAYYMLTQKTDDVPLLVLAGKKGWLFESIFETVKKYQLEDKIVFTGYVSEEDAPVLLFGAKAFVFPSLYEGFGMPPLEAMACGTPVITSNCTSLPEVVGDCGILVNPLETEEICDAMFKLLDDDELCKKLSKDGRKRAEEFTWKRASDIVLKVCEELVKG